MCVFLISPVPITKPLTSELIDTPVFYNLAPRPIKYRVSVPIPTLASHKMMILQNRVALDYILATQGGACTIIGPECCTGLMDPTENLNKIQQDILGLSEKLRQMTEDNSSWFGNLLGKPWLWIKEIAILLLFLLLAYYLCIHSIKCFCQQMTPASHKEMTVPTRKDYYP